MADTTQDAGGPTNPTVATEVKSPSLTKCTPKKRVKQEVDKDHTPTKRQKSASIASSEAQLTDADKMLIRMRDEGKPWTDINAAWEQVTGIKPGSTTLRIRYGRLKANLARVKEEDIETMKEAVDKAKAEIEEEKKQLDKKLWHRVVEKMVAEGTEKYEVGTVEKQYKSLA